MIEILKSSLKFLITSIFEILFSLSYGLGFAVSTALLYVVFFIFGYSFSLWMFYYIIKSVPKTHLEMIILYVKAVNPDYWAMKRNYW